MPQVRVLLGARPTVSVGIEIGGPYLVTSPGDWRVLAQGSSLPAAEATATDHGLRIGARTFSADKIDLRVVQPDTLWVGSTRYAGHLRLIRRADGRIAAINLVGLEEYVRGALGQVAMDGAGHDDRQETPEEAVRAQAIVLRSRTLYEMKTAGAAGGDWDLDDAASGLPPYRGLESRDGQRAALRHEESRWREIVGQTRGIVLTYQGRLFLTCFTAACGGHTLDGRLVFPAAAPPLIGVACPVCQAAASLPWEKTVAGETLRSRVAKYCQKTGHSLGPLVRIEVSDAPVGRVPEVTLVGTQGTCRLSAHLFRTQVAGEDLLAGNVSTVEQQEDSYHFTGRGVGHGVGLCQAGACGLAQNGRTCLEILAHYFPGAEWTPVW